jgi:hypothetical protein
MRSIANVEFHHVVDKTDDVVREIVSKLETLGVRAINAGAVGFPMEMDRFGAGRLHWSFSVDVLPWVRFVRKEVKLPWLLLRRKLRFRGSPRLLQAFGKCFPS